MDKRQGLLARISKDDPRYDVVKQGTHIVECCEFVSRSENDKPYCKAYFDNGVIATVLGSSNPSPDDWFKQLADRFAGTDQTARLTIEIENLSKKDIYDGFGVIAVPISGTDQYKQKYYAYEVSTNKLDAIADEIEDYLDKPENAGKGDQRPRGQKDEDLMTILRIAAKRNGYVDETLSKSYSRFTNDVLWAAIEQGLPFRVRHAIIDNKSGDAHYTNKQ